MKKLWYAMLATMGLTGCQATPGFQMGWTFTIPPTLNSTSALHPIPTAPTTTYGIEATPNMPVVTRQIQTIPHPVQQPIATTPAAPALKPQALPMPQPGGGAVNQGCGSSYQE